MSAVLSNVKKVYRNLTQLKELEKQQLELELKINKLKDSNSEPLSKWARPANKAHLLELYRNEVELLEIKERLKKRIQSQEKKQ